MSFEQHFDETRLILKDKIPIGHAEQIYRHTIKHVMDSQGIELTIVDTYSAKKSSELITYDNKTYLVIDHALLEHFNLLNSLRNVSDTGLVCAMLNRTLGEICRSLSHLKHYAFSTQRAIEVKPYFRALSQSGPHSLSIFWQSFTTIAHEAAHAIPQDSQLREDLYLEAKLDTSYQINLIILEANRKLGNALESSTHDDIEANEDLQLLLDSIDNDKGAISSVFLAKIGDEAFIEEIVCDRFASHVLAAHLKVNLGNDNELNFDTVSQVLLSAHATFLNMRLNNYLIDMARTIGEAIPEKVNPIKQNGLVEFTIRGNLFANRLVEVWSEIFSEAGQKLPNIDFKSRIQNQNKEHTDALFVPANALLDITLLSPSFTNELNSLLIGDGYDIDIFESTPWKAIDLIDVFWKISAS
jgi:hypothetical protein